MSNNITNAAPTATDMTTTPTTVMPFATISATPIARRTTAPSIAEPIPNHDEWIVTDGSVRASPATATAQARTLRWRTSTELTTSSGPIG